MATKKPAKVAVITLAMIVAAGADGLFTPASIHAPLVEAGMVEINPAVTNPAGEIATRATQAGIDAVAAAAAEKPAAPAAKYAFAVEADVPMPSGASRGRTANTYPFETMEVGHSFFVPNTDEKPNAAKSLASTVSSATARYAVEQKDEAGNVVMKTNRKGESVPAMTETRKFVVRAVDETAKGRGPGARVWRTA